MKASSAFCLYGLGVLGRLRLAAPGMLQVDPDVVAAREILLVGCKETSK